MLHKSNAPVRLSAPQLLHQVAPQPSRLLRLDADRPSRLLRRGAAYSYRRRVPEDLRRLGLPREVVRALGTGSRTRALQLARRIDERVGAAFVLARWSSPSASPSARRPEGRALKPEELRKLVDELLSRIPPEDHQASIDGPLTFEDVARDLMDWEMAQAGVLEKVLRPLRTPAVPAGQPVLPSINLRQALERYFADPAGHQWSPQYEKVTRTRLGRLQEHLGANRALASISKADVLAFRETLRARTDGRGRGRGAKVSEKTVRQHLVSAGTFLSYCVAADWITSNPAANLPGARGQGRPRPDEERPAVGDDDLRRMFADLHQAREETRWALLLLAYTGARRGEVAQLWVADIAPVGGVPCMRIEPAADPATPKHVKSSAGRRVVPLHADLLELGLLAFVEAARAAGRKQLFPSLTSRGGDPLSRWWQLRRDRVGLSERCQLHGLRHRFISQLKHAGFDEPRIAQLVGHANQSLTTGRYGKRYDVQRLAEAVAAVQNREPLAPLFERVL